MDVKFTPKKAEAGGYYVRSSNLPPMISSVEAKLGAQCMLSPASIIPSPSHTGSLVSQLPSLNFLVLVPHKTHSPLLIRDPQGQYTDNFLVPQWGGVVFYNPPQWENGDEGKGVEVNVEMEKVMAVFVRQLQMLLGIPQPASSSPKVVLEPGNLGITEWVYETIHNRELLTICL